MTTQLARRSFFRHAAGAAAAGVLAAPLLDLGSDAAAEEPLPTTELRPSGADDTAAIRNALDRTGSAVLGAGTFRVSQIPLSTGQQLLMSMQSVVQGIAGARPPELVKVLDADGVRIDGGILDGAGQGACTGVAIFGGQRVIVTRTRSINMAGYGFTVGTSFNRTSSGIVLRGVSGGMNQAGGILVSSGERIQIVDAEIVDSGGPGVLLAPSGPWDALAHVMVRGCELARNLHGVRVVGAAGGLRGAAVVGNNIHHNRDRGIDALPRGEEGFLVDGNVLAANGGDGVVVEAAVNGARIVDNEIRDNGGAGLRLRSCQRWEARGNQIVRQRGAGMVVHPGATPGGENFGIISHNQIWDNSVAAPGTEGGIRLEGAAGQKPSVSLIGNWYGNFTSPGTQRSGVLNVGPFDRKSVVASGNRATGHPEVVNI